MRITAPIVCQCVTLHLNHASDSHLTPLVWDHTLAIAIVRHKQAGFYTWRIQGSRGASGWHNPCLAGLRASTHFCLLPAQRPATAASQIGESAMTATAAIEHKHVACPFCGLSCQDLRINVRDGHFEVDAMDCAQAACGYARASGITNQTPSPTIRGQTCNIADATLRAAEILGQANSPLVGGLGCDVAGVRAAVDLAERIGGTLDHMHGDSIARNVLALQDGGWMTASMTEVRNRADLIVVIGSEIFDAYPRFGEKILWPEKPSNLEIKSRTVIVLGSKTTAAGSDHGARHVTLPREQLTDVLAAIGCLLRGRPLQATAVAGISFAELKDIVERLKQARYGAIIWSAAHLDFPHSELTIQMVAELIAELNNTNRFIGMPLTGPDGTATAQQVCTWKCGFPLRTSFAKGYPDYDPYSHGTLHLLATGQADALLWISSFNAQSPPTTSAPTIVLGHGATRCDSPPEVFIPVGTPGIDHAGLLFRGDGVAALPLPQLRNSALPSTADVIGMILSQLPR